MRSPQTDPQGLHERAPQRPRNDWRRPRLPPGPDAGPFSQTIAFHRDPLRFLRRAQGRYGNVFTIRLLTARPLVVVADPTAVEPLSWTDPDRGHAGEARRQILPFASPRSVFGADGAVHREARGRLEPVFTEEAMSARAAEMARIAERHAETWPRGRPFRLLPRVRTLLDEIFVRLVLGVHDNATAEGLVKALRRMLWTPVNPPVTVPGEGDGLFGLLGQALFERRQAPVATLLARAIEDRRRAPEGNDVLGSMVREQPGLPTEAIVDELMSLLMAAQEPPSIALTWLLDRLGREGSLAEQFRSSPRSELSDAVVRETLRLQPPAAGVLRRLTEPMTIDGFALPAGADLMAPLALIHRDPRVYVEPDDFDPGRWLENPPTAAHLPFGGGARRCVGEPLAHAEINTVVPTLLNRIVLRPLSRAPERMVVRGTVMVPVRGALVVAK